MKISTATGLFRGTFILPGESGVRTFRGAILRPNRSGAGFFHGDAKSGGVSFERRGYSTTGVETQF